MKVISIVLSVIAAIATAGCAIANESKGVNPQPAQVESVVECDEPASVLTSVAEVSEVSEQESNYYNACFNGFGVVNLSFIPKYPPDSASTSDIEKFLKKIIPIAKNLDILEIL